MKKQEIILFFSFDDMVLYEEKESLKKVLKKTLKTFLKKYHKGGTILFIGIHAISPSLRNFYNRL